MPRTKLIIPSPKQSHEQVMCYRTIMAAYQRQRNARLREQGLCTSCGKRKARKDYKTCGPCQSHSKKVQRRAERRKAQGLPLLGRWPSNPIPMIDTVEIFTQTETTPNE